MNSDAIKTAQFSIGGMDCPDCGIKIEKRIRHLKGVEEATVNFVTTLLTVRYHPSSVAIRMIEQELRSLGYSVRGRDRFVFGPAYRFLDQPFLLVLLSGLLTFAGFGFSYNADRSLSAILYVGAVVLGGYPIARRGLAAMRQWAMDMNVLMTLAVSGAVALGDYPEAAAVVVLFSLAQWLELSSIERSRKAIKDLVDLTPVEAVVRRGETDQLISVDQVGKGEIVVVRPGGKIPFDGMVVEGNSAVDQSSMTGEAMPEEKMPGDEVYAGTLNLRGTLLVRVSHVWSDSRMSRVIHMVEEAASRKASSQRLIDAFSGYYTPAVVCLAAGVAVVPPLLFNGDWSQWFYRGLVLVVISCPCALVISTPVTVVSGLAAAARQGILIKGGLFLEEMGRIRNFVFDKTGTLTTGKAEIREVVNFSSASDPILQIAASLERDSRHPVGEAISSHAARLKIRLLPVTGFQVYPGLGAAGNVMGKSCLIGNHRFFRERALCSGEIDEAVRERESEGHTTVLVGTDSEVLGMIVLSDALRPEAASGIKGLRQAGIEKIHMVTGDHAANAKMIARVIHLDEFHAALLPDEKAKIIGALRRDNAKVAMVGDGINDAPALASASVGIAMGEKGAEVSVETADVVLMSDNLMKLPYLVRLGKKTISLVRQNLIFAVGIKGLFLIMAVAGISTLWMAVAADMGVSLLVIMNGMRIVLLKPTGEAAWLRVA